MFSSFEMFDLGMFGSIGMFSPAHHAKMDLNKKSFPKKKNLQTFKVDAKGFRKNRNENFPT